MPDFTPKQIIVVVLFGVGMMIVSAVVVGIFVLWVPADYFVSEKRQSLLVVHSSAASIALRIGKNFLGVLLVVVGIILAVPGVPGQGVLTILIGILFLDVPGKHKLARRIVRRPGIHRTLNRLRARYGKEPLMAVPDLEDDVSEP